MHPRDGVRAPLLRAVPFVRAAWPSAPPWNAGKGGGQPLCVSPLETPYVCYGLRCGRQVLICFRPDAQFTSVSFVVRAL